MISSILGNEKLPPGDEEAVRELFNEYASSKDEYLVDGAILTCNMVFTGTQLIRGVIYGTDIEGVEKGTETQLMVSKNISEINGMPVATVKDYGENNIEPFKCNCLNLPDRESEFQAILEDEECQKYGTCRQLMKLDDDWENIIRSTSYLSFNGSQGITINSMLFCSHGGLITPVTSGQILFEKYLEEPDIHNIQQVKEYVWFYFRSKNFSMETVAGIMGNVQRECQFDLELAASINPNRFGLFQWSNNPKEARRKAFNSWAIDNNYDVNLISVQCEYAYIEMTTNGMFSIILDKNEDNPNDLLCNYQTLISAKDPEDAAKIFATSFERCCTESYWDENRQLHYKNIQHSKDRQFYAGEIYKEMKDMER